jgi:hypothetical protein
MDTLLSQGVGLHETAIYRTPPDSIGHPSILAAGVLGQVLKGKGEYLTTLALTLDEGRNRQAINPMDALVQKIKNTACNP